MIYGLLAAFSFFFQNLGNKEFGQHFPCKLAGIALLNAFALSIVAVIAGFAAGFAPLQDPRVWALSVLFGAVYMVTIFLIVASLSSGPLSASTLILNMSMVIPVLVGLFVWHEEINLMRAIGILSMFAVVILSAIGGRSGSQKASVKWLILVLGGTLSNGVLTVIKKSLTQYFPAANSIAFTFWGFLFAATFCWLIVLVLFARGERFQTWTSKKPAFVRSVLGVGLGSGGGNLVQMYGLRTVPAIIMFPVTQGSLIIILWLLSVIHYKEPVRVGGIISVILGVAGVVLLGVF